MIKYSHGNLLEADVEAVVNTVNTIGVMGKGIALMFKERYPENYELYSRACKAGEVSVGHMFVTERNEFFGPHWIINFPTKQHWRHPSKIEWVVVGLTDLKRVIIEKNIRSIAIPPLGCGNGGLAWNKVKPLIEHALKDLDGVEIVIYEPTSEYQNVSKRAGVEKLTPARALIAELVRRYWILGIECTLLEVQKLAWFLERMIVENGLDNPLDLRFTPNKFGPYANRLNHLLNALDGSYLHCDKRIGDAGPLDTIWFEDSKTNAVHAYIDSEAKEYKKVLDKITGIIDGFESPLGLELLATVDWLVKIEKIKPELDEIKNALKSWMGGGGPAQRKVNLFNDRMLTLALNRLQRAA